MLIEVVRWHGAKRTKAYAEPAPFGQKRAEEIWQSRGIQWEVEHAMTDGELAYVTQIHDERGGEVWMWTFLEILNGRLEPKP